MNDFESRLRSALQEETLDISARSSLADDMVTRGSKARRRRRLAGGVAVLAVLASIVPIWHTVDTSGSRLQPVAPTPTETSHPTPTKPTAVQPTWGTHPVSVTDHPDPSPQVVDLRVGQHGGYDRIVIDLAGALPGYRVAYLPGLTFAGSGQHVPLQGSAFLSIQLTPATGTNAAGDYVYQGAALHVYDMPTLLGIAVTDNTEGHFTFGVALSKQAGFRLLRLSSPTRLVIDVRH